jgi:hypothetical protein
MSHCKFLGSYSVTELAAQLNAHPELWDEHPMRTGWKDGPFTETSDIWLRFGDDPETWGGPHFPAFYPAWYLLPALHPIVFNIMSRMHATSLGGVLIARIPPRKSIPPHTDAGAWHAEFYPHKAYVVIRSNPQCVNRYEDEEYNLPEGEAWLFNNLVTHSVENRGDTERVAAIVCMRTE